MRRSKRELKREIDALADNHDAEQSLGWIDFLRIEAGDRAPEDYGLTQRAVDRQFAALLSVTTTGGQ